MLRIFTVSTTLDTIALCAFISYCYYGRNRLIFSEKPGIREIVLIHIILSQDAKLSDLLNITKCEIQKLGRT